MKIHIVIRELSKNFQYRLINSKNTTMHVLERQGRFEEYRKRGLLENFPVAGFEVDRGHIHGTEFHIITNTGLIYTYNSNTRRFITILGARPEQISRYYEEGAYIPYRVYKVIKLAAERMKTDPIHNL